jgi:hypothetical protein
MAKRLVDLYAIGAEVSFEDPDGGSPIVVYLKKLQPFEQEVAMNRANIQRAKVLTLKRLSQENEEILPYELQLDDNFNDEEIIDFISSEDVAKAYRSAEAKVSEEEQWAKEDYITGLQDSWEELKDHLHSDEYPEQHADAKRVFEELSKLSNEVDKLFNKEKARIIR